MFVSRVTSVNSNMLGAMPSSANKHKSLNVSNPSFRALYKPLTAKLILKYVPQHEMERYSGMMMSAIFSFSKSLVKIIPLYFVIIKL